MQAGFQTMFPGDKTTVGTELWVQKGFNMEKTPAGSSLLTEFPAPHDGSSENL